MYEKNQKVPRSTYIAMVNTVSTDSSELHIWMEIDLNVALCFQSVLQKNEKIQSGL